MGPTATTREPTVFPSQVEQHIVMCIAPLVGRYHTDDEDAVPPPMPLFLLRLSVSVISALRRTVLYQNCPARQRDGFDREEACQLPSPQRS